MKTACLIGVLTLLTLQGCTKEPDVDLTLAVRSRDSAVVAQTRDVLLSRFTEVRPSFFSTIETAIQGSTIHFTFKGGAPPPMLLELLHGTRGRLRAFLPGYPAEADWFTDQDVAEVRFAYENSTPQIRIRLVPAAGARVERLSNEYLGQVVRVTLDRDTLRQRPIRCTVSDRGTRPRLSERPRSSAGPDPHVRLASSRGRAADRRQPLTASSRPISARSRTRRPRTATSLPIATKRSQSPLNVAKP